MGLIRKSGNVALAKGNCTRLEELRLHSGWPREIDGVAVVPELVQEEEQHAVSGAHVQNASRMPDAVCDFAEAIHAAGEYVVQCGVGTCVESAAALEIAGVGVNLAPGEPVYGFRSHV